MQTDQNQIGAAAENVDDADTIKPPAPASKFFRFGMAVVLAIFGGLTLWSILAPIDSAVIASGQIVVESNRKAVQHLEGGVVGEVLVREGQLVDAGEVLARLDNKLAKANLSQTDSQLSELFARRARLKAERDSLDEIGEPTGIDEVLNSREFQASFAGQRNLLAARAATRARRISLLDEQITQQKERINGISAQRRSIASQSRLINDELESVRELHGKGFAPLTRLRALERENERLRGERGSLTARLAEAESVITEAQLEKERMRETSREEAITELRDVEVQIAELSERRITAADAFVRTEIKAPQAGRVIGLSIHTVGGVITPGEALMEIVPDGDKLEVAARVSPTDIEKVHTGQEALIRFSSFSARMTPETTGSVRSVSADSLIDQVTGAPYFLVLIDLPAAPEMSEILSGQPLIPGMPAEAFIRTGKRPAISYLLRPFTDAVTRSMRED